MTSLELAVRTIDDMLPELTTKQLHEWHAILKSAVMKVERELSATKLHTCQICFFQEYGYRDELPAAWYSRAGANICFQHDYDESEKLLKEAGYHIEAFLPPDIPDVSIESLRLISVKEAVPEKTALDELMAIL